jgi:hypothetical protein
MWHTCVQDSVGKSEGNSLLGRPKQRCEDNIKMDLEKQSGRVWTVFIWFSIGTSQWLILVRYAGPYCSAKPDLWIRIHHWDNSRFFYTW